MGSLHGWVRLCVASAIVAMAVACGEDAPNPSNPASPSSPASGGATINGQVVNATSGLNAAVVGTSISTAVAANGGFSLSRVPVNNVQLRFTGPGTNATLPLGTLQEGETVSIRVMVNGNSAALQGSGDDNDDDDNDNDDDDADEANEVEVTARVEGKAGSCPAITFTAGGRRVRTSPATFFRRVTCDLLVDGQLVEVEGPIVSNELRAEKVQLEDARGVERRGNVSNASGGCPSLTFTVGGQIFFTSSTTEFKDLSCGQIGNGSAVRADGHIQSNGRALAERVRPE